MKVLMVVPDQMVMGGIASVVNGYRKNGIKDAEIIYVESYRNGSKLQKLTKALGAYAEFRRILRNNEIDLVHIHSSFGPSFYRKRPFINMAFRRHIPVVNHIHGAEFDRFYANASKSKKKAVEKCYRKCSELIALSKEWRDRLALIVPKDRIEVISNYCEIPKADEISNSTDVLFMGEIGQRKGCYDIPLIFERLRGMSFTLTMAGNGDVQELQSCFGDIEVGFPGWVRGEDKDRLLRQSGIFLFPSYNEGVPMALLEAMGHGLAVVTTNVGGIPTVVEDGVNGYMCTPGDIDRLSECVGKLLKDSELRNRMGAKARESIIQNYSFEKHVDSLYKLYEKVIKQYGISR